MRARPNYILANSETLPEILSILEECIKRHDKALKSGSIDSPDAAHKLLVLRARYDGMMQLVRDFTDAVNQK